MDKVMTGWALILAVFGAVSAAAVVLGSLILLTVKEVKKQNETAQILEGNRWKMLFETEKARSDQLQTTINDLQQRLTNLDQRFTAQQTEVTSLHALNIKLQEEVRRLNHENANLRQENVNIRTLSPMLAAK